MPFVITTSATIMCAHGGRVQLMPKQQTVLAGGAPILRETDLIGAPVVGCAQPPTVSSKPCTTVVSTIPMSGTASTLLVGGMPAHTQTVTGMTDGVPPGTIQVVDPGQQQVQA